jgi:UDP-2-acetamido-2,6-beta-L-arabino-hexul-4-ose reductase
MTNKKIGITGHNGFLGSHLKNHIRYQYDNFDIIDFDRSFFESENDLSVFIKSCDVIVHLAGLNRHNSKDEILKTNIKLAETLGSSLLKNQFKGCLIFSSSIQEYYQTPYGKSKKRAGDVLTKAAISSGFTLIHMIIPNIFGPFGKPNFNSFISTFSHKLILGETPEIIKDDNIPLIYVESVVNHILNQIDHKGIHKIEIPKETEKRVSEILGELKNFHQTYINEGFIPKLENIFDIQLFNTFRSALDYSKYFPKSYMLHIDERGHFSELIRSHSQSQQSYSITKPGVTRGNHFHTRKIERFSVIKGEATIQMRKIGTKKSMQFKLMGEKPSYVDMPVWTTHNITNTGKEDLITIFWINEHYNQNDPDVYFEKV